MTANLERKRTVVRPMTASDGLGQGRAIVLL